MGSTLEEQQKKAPKPKDRMVSDESPEVSKAEFKRLNRIFNNPSTGRRKRLSEVETNNAYVMMKNKKNFTNDEIREMATNPHGRIDAKKIINRNDGGMVKKTRVF